MTSNTDGDYTVNITTAFSSANYVPICLVRGTAGPDSYCSVDYANAPTASTLRVTTIINSLSVGDVETVYVAMFGDQ